MIEEINKQDEVLLVEFNEYLKQLNKLQGEFEHIGGGMISIGTMLALLIGFKSALDSGKMTYEMAENSMRYSLSEAMKLIRVGDIKKDDEE